MPLEGRWGSSYAVPIEGAGDGNPILPEITPLLLQGVTATILHICGNLTAGKTTTVEALAQLRWPVVSIGRVRNVCHDEWLAWRIVGRLWCAWDSPDLTPGRSGIWVSTGLNWNEHTILALMPARYLRRVWLTADPEILRARMATRNPRTNTGYWPYNESWAELQEALMGYNDGTRPLPWPIDRSFDTGILSIGAIVADIMSLIEEPWPAEPPSEAV